MKTATLVLAASLAGAAVAQLGSLPSCATSCLTQYTSSGQIAGCNNVDIKCICSNSSFLSGIACCLAGSCSESDQEAATKYAEQLCRTNGVTNLPASVSCASSTSSAPTSSPSAGATTTPSSGATTTGDATGAAAPTSGSPTGSSSAAASSSTGAGVQNIAAMGAGLAGGLAAVAALL